MVKLTIKPISKLTILFIFTILIPGIILSYFSIQNIANQKELTEKKLLEEQNQIAVSISQKFQQQIETNTIQFFNLADSLGNNLSKHIHSLDSLRFVDMAFDLNKDGKFVHPNIFPESSVSQFRITSKKYFKIYLKAEQLEYSKSDFISATNMYKNAIRVAEKKLEKAKAVNGLARVLFKRKLFDQSSQHYSYLAKWFGSEIDDSGIPFAYYSLYQLTRMYSISPDMQYINDLKLILSAVYKNSIPLTNHIEIILSDLEDTILKQDYNNLKSDPDMVLQINSIKKKLKFANEDAQLIRQYLSDDLIYPVQPVANNFNGIMSSTEGQPALLVVNSSQKYNGITGFKMNLDFIRNKVLSEITNTKTEYDLELQIVNRNQLSQKDSERGFLLIRDLSLFVPSWQIWIKPKSQDILNQYITTRRWVYSITLIFLIFGMFLGIFLVYRDMSREKRLGQLRSDFVSNVTHELKTPLTSICMFAETMLLGRIKKKKEQQEYLSIIVNETERLKRLINNVLEFSKIEKNIKQYHFESVHLSKVLESAVNSMKYWLDEQGFKIIVNIEPQIKTKADGDAIEQAVLNLLSNAMKYSYNRKEIDLHLGVENQSIFIRVKDKGIGIPQSKQKRIFDKYYRAHSDHHGDKGGAGLGLTVIKHIVGAHKGKIKVESQVNQGSIFTIILPVIKN